MADDSQLAEATQALSFAEFLERMKDPQAANLVRSIKNFIKTFDDKPANPDRDAESVQAFLAKSEGTFRNHPVWANVPVEHQSQAMEGLEKYLMTKIYYKTFAQSELDKERDVALSQRMAALSFVQPHHLDIPQQYQEDNSSQLAIKELHKINNYKAPRDKLVCVLNCCRVINNLLHNAGIKDNEARGADDFLPVLIYVVIHANPPQLASNLEYIQRFRMHSRMVSESAYFFTQLYSAASFIETINSSSLTMDSDEFVARMIAAGVPDIEAASTQPLFPKLKADTTPSSPTAGASLIPAASEDNMGLTPQPSQPSLANTPSKGPEEGSVRPVGSAFQHLAQPEAASPGTYAATATPFQGGSQSILAPTPSISGKPSLEEAGPGPGQGASGAGNNSLTATQPAAGPPPAATQAEPWPSVPELEQEGVSQLVQSEAAGQLQQRYTYLYSLAPDLRMDDIPLLLRQYKELTLKHEALVSAIEAHRASQQCGAASWQPQLTPGASQDNAGTSQQMPTALPSSSSPHTQAALLDSAHGSGASPFSHASAQAAFSANLDTAMPSSAPIQDSAVDKPAGSPHDHVTHMPFGPVADSPFEQPEPTSTANVSEQSAHGDQEVAHHSSRHGIDAVGSGHEPSDAQVRNSLTTASQPLPPESTAELDASTVDDRHMTMSSAAALDQAVQSENAHTSPQGAGGRNAAAASDAQNSVASDMFSGLDVETNGQNNAD
ncbi:hypothetical protein WJX77_002566 [Trebouxia sp. C0004]